MATTLTPNLKLRVDSNLTSNSKYNLSRIDLLGGTFLVDSTNTLKIRSQTNLLLEPNSADIGGSGSGGTVSIGSASQVLDSLQVYTTVFNLSTSLGLADQATGGTKNLQLKYKSDLSGSVDTAADRNLQFDLQGADRNVILAGDLTTSGGNISLASAGPSSVSLPSSGVLATLAGSETFSNKVLDATQNTIQNIGNSSISNSAGIAYSKLNLGTSIQNSDISTSAAIAYSKLALTGSILDADVSASAALSRSKLAAGSSNHVLINDGSGVLSSEATLSKARGGAGADMSSVTFPSSGVLLTDTNAVTVQNKTISGAQNTISGVSYGSLVLTNSITDGDVSSSAAISYSKLNLSGGIVNSDVSSSAAIGYSKLNLASAILNSDISASAAIAYSKLNLTSSIVNADVSASAAIAGTKISPNFGNQLIQTLVGIEFEEGGYTTLLQAAPGGQSSDLTFSLPPTSGTAGQVLASDGAGAMDWVTVAGTGTVTSVDLAVPAEFSVSGNPITTAGTITIAKANQNTNLVYAGPSTGAAAAPTFRSLVLADMPSGVTLQASTTWAPADGATKTFTHNLGTTDIDVQIIDDSSEIVYVGSITVDDANNITLTSSETPAGTWTVVVQGS